MLLCLLMASCPLLPPALLLAPGSPTSPPTPVLLSLALLIRSLAMYGDPVTPVLMPRKAGWTTSPRPPASSIFLSSCDTVDSFGNITVITPTPPVFPRLFLAFCSDNLKIIGCDCFNSNFD